MLMVFSSSSSLRLRRLVKTTVVPFSPFLTWACSCCAWRYVIQPWVGWLPASAACQRIGMFIPLYPLPVAAFVGIVPMVLPFFQGFSHGAAPCSSSWMMLRVTLS
jgi:hypothetical protein